MFEIKLKRGGYTGRFILLIGLVLVSGLVVSALNQSENSSGVVAAELNSTEETSIGMIPIESEPSTPSSSEIPISILPVKPPAEETQTSEFPTSAAISVPPIPSDENQNVPVEEPTVTIPEVPVEPVVPPVEEPVPSLLSTFLNIVLEKVKFFVGEVIEIQATLTDQHSNPLPDKKVDFYADEQIIGTNLTDSAGTAKVSWNTSSWMPGAYTIRADYAGDGGSEAVSAERSILVEEDIAELESIVQNITEFTGEWPKFPFQFKDHTLPDNFSMLRPELIKDNKGGRELKDKLEAAGYIVPALSFGLDKNGYYVYAALIETKSGNYEAEARELFEGLYGLGYADFYGVEILDVPANKFVDYYVSKSALMDFQASKMSIEEFSSNAGAKVNELPPPPDPRIPRTWQKVEITTR